MEFRKSISSIEAAAGLSIPEGQAILVRKNDLEILIKKVSKSSRQRNDEGFITSDQALSLIFPLSKVS